MPEVLALDASGGNADYFSWAFQETAAGLTKHTTSAAVADGGSGRSSSGPPGGAAGTEASAGDREAAGDCAELNQEL